MIDKENDLELKVTVSEFLTLPESRCAAPT